MGLAMRHPHLFPVQIKENVTMRGLPPSIRKRCSVGRFGLILPLQRESCGLMRGLFLFPTLLLLTGCKTLQFYSQGIRGQAEITFKAQPNSRLLRDPATPELLKQKLLLARELTNFASLHLDLPGHSSYHRYADLGRRHVVFVIHAAPEFSLKPKTWRYPIVGELEYRGYFKEEDAQAFAAGLQQEGYDVYMGGTNAYSTIGFFHDPLLNTFIEYREIDFAELIFHELTHRRHFRKGETMFNESLANTLGEEGVRLWLKSRGHKTEQADYEERLIRRKDFYREIDATRAQLEKLYASGLPEAEMRQRKQVILGNLKARARALQQRWGTKQLEAWLRLDLTNAHLNSIAAYHEQIPRFRQVLREAGGDFKTFFNIVEKLPVEEE